MNTRMMRQTISEVCVNVAGIFLVAGAIVVMGALIVVPFLWATGRL